MTATAGRKSPSAFRTISEVATEIRVPAHVLRFWESKFTQINPMKRGGGRRFYRPEDVELLRWICKRLHDEGYTIRGVQKLLKSGAYRLDVESKASGGSSVLFDDSPTSNRAPSKAPQAASASALSLAPEQKLALRETLRELQSLRDILAQVAR